jgi:hypothetical protein
VKERTADPRTFHHWRKGTHHKGRLTQLRFLKRYRSADRTGSADRELGIGS